MPLICVIRNPIDRFISSSIYLYHHYNQWSFKDDDTLQKRMEGEDFFPFLELVLFFSYAFLHKTSFGPYRTIF